MNKEHTKLKKLSIRTPEERQAAEQKRTTAVMGALKAVHSATSPTPWSRRTWSASAKARSCWGVS